MYRCVYILATSCRCVPMPYTGCLTDLRLVSMILLSRGAGFRDDERWWRSHFLHDRTRVSVCTDAIVSLPRHVDVSVSRRVDVFRVHIQAL